MPETAAAAPPDDFERQRADDLRKLTAPARRLARKVLTWFGRGGGSQRPA